MSKSEQDPSSIVTLAAQHGLSLDPKSVVFNEVGLDFRVAFARASDGVDWVLRMPRRPDAVKKSKREADILKLVRRHLSVAVPDWKVHTDALIAYPRLPGEPGLSFNPETAEVTWHFDKKSPTYARELAKVLLTLHRVEPDEAQKSGLIVLTPSEVRERHRENMARVRCELGVADALWMRWQAWLADDSYWPEVSRLTHTELYPAHVLIDGDAAITGIIDWTEAVVGDPVADFATHLLGFGEEGFTQLVGDYHELGGRTAPRLKEHCQEYLAAAPVHYAIFALTTRDAQHLNTAKIQLGVATV